MIVESSSYEYSIDVNVGFFQTFSPSSSGTYSGWTPSVGERWSCVDDNWLVANDTDYIHTATSGTKCSFNFDNWVGTATIDYLTVFLRARQVTGTPNANTKVRLFHYEGGTETAIQDFTVGITYDTYQVTVSNNPITGAAWTTAQINDMEWGVELTATGTPTETNVSNLFVRVVPATISGSATLNNIFVSASYDFVEARDGGLCDTDYLLTYFQGNDYEIVPEYETLAYPTSRMRFFEDSISSGEVKTTKFYFRATGFGDQYTSTDGYPWMASEDDTCYISDDASLDFDTESFYISADIELLNTPSSGTHSVVSKLGNYDVYLSNVAGSVKYFFKTFTATGTETAISINATVNSKVTLSAWYDGAKMIISDGNNQAYAILSGTLAVTANDIHVCEIDAVIDNLEISVD